MDVKFDFVEYKKNNFSGYTLIEGFPGMGLVGTIAVKYLVEKMKMEQIGYIDSNIFTPIIRIHAGIPVRPARIYADKKRKICVLIAEQVIPKEHTYIASKKTIEWIKSQGIKELISLSRIQAAPETKSKEVIYGISANEKCKPILKKFGITEIGEGITTGVTAFMLLELKNSKIKAISILGNVKIAADYKAAAEVLKKLNKVMNFKLDVEPLLKEARETEKKVIEHLQNLKTTTDKTDNFEVKTPIVT